MNPAALEAAWQTFVTHDVSIRDDLALEYAEVDNARFGELQQMTFTGTPDEVSRGADGLVAFAEEIKSAKVWDQVVGAAFDRAKRHADALEARRRALLVAATWHPQECGRVLGNLGWGLQCIGQGAEAERWYGRALLWDHENPYVLGSLAELWVARGGVEPALALRAHMTAFGVPASHFEDLDKALAARGVAPATPVAPNNPYGPSTLGRLDLRAFLTFAACSDADGQMSDQERFHNLALAAAMTRDLPAALAHVRAAVREASDDPIATAWTRALAASIERATGGAAPRPGLDDPDPEARGRALDAAANAKDAATVLAFAKDPVLPLALVAVGVVGIELGQLDVPNVLGPIAAFEDARGLDVHPGSAGHLVRRARRRTLGPRPTITIPEEGLGHPLFAVLEPGESLVVFVALDDALPPEQQAALADSVEAFERAHDAKTLELSFGAAPGSAMVTFTNPKKMFGKKAQDPRPAAQAFLDAVARSGAPFASIVLERGTLPRGKSQSLFHPVGDPRMKSRFDLRDADAVAAALDPNAPQPHPEPEGGLFMILPSGGQYLPEWRSTPPVLQGARVCYGLVDKVENRPRDPRTDAFRDALRASMDRWFRKEPVVFRDKDRKDFEVDPIAWRHKRGYRVFIEGVCPEMLMNLPGTFRYREYELFVAFRDACRATGVVPVIQWMRDGGVWIVNVWEA